MTRPQIYAAGGALVAGAVLVAFLFLRKPKATKGGAAKGSGSVDGVVTTPPAELAAAVGEGLHVYAAARMAASEGKFRADKIARLWVAINDARALGWLTSDGHPDIFRLVTYHKAITSKVTKKTTPNPRNGKFGVQRGGGRYATTNEPTRADLDLAKEVLGGKIPDPTGGATKFVDRKSLLVQKGVTRTYETIVADWAKQGLRPATVAGLSPDFVVFRRA